MTFTDLLWKQTLPVFNAIIKHPFITEMGEGTLDRRRFLFYMEQDAHYLVAFSKALAQIAARSSEVQDIDQFLQFAEGALVAERELHAKFLGKKRVDPAMLLSPANLSYTHFLLATASLKPLHEALAAILPCFWIYREVGLAIIQKAGPHNPYDEWLVTYSGEEFAKQTTKAIHLIENMAQRASLHDREMMCRAFFTSAVFEWHFWNDAYQMNLFEKSFVHSKSLFCHEPILVGSDNIDLNC